MPDRIRPVNGARRRSAASERSVEDLATPNSPSAMDGVRPAR